MNPTLQRRLSKASFRFGYGSHALDLAVTLRRRASEPVELLATTDDAARWLAAAGIVKEAPRLAESDLGELRQLRDAVYRIGCAATKRQTPASADLRILNQMARRSDAVPQLDDDWSVRAQRSAVFDSALAAIARDAIEIFGNEEQRAHLRTCEQDDCAGLFLDRSRGERRRWCSMARCGSRAKVAAFRKRQKEEKS